MMQSKLETGGREKDQCLESVAWSEEESEAGRAGPVLLLLPFHVV